MSIVRGHFNQASYFYNKISDLYAALFKNLVEKALRNAPILHPPFAELPVARHLWQGFFYAFLQVVQRKKALHTVFFF